MNSKRINMFLSLVCVLVLALSIPSMLVADDDDDSKNGNERCKLQGAWVWDTGPLKWLLTFNGAGDNEGTMDMEFVGPADPENCPGCYYTSTVGVWAKSGHGTYNWTFQGYFVDGYGEVIFIPLNEGTITLTGCNTAEVYGEAKLFWPGADEAFMQWDYLPPQEMQRLLLHQPSPIQ